MEVIIKKTEEYGCPVCGKWFKTKEVAEKCAADQDEVPKYKVGDRVKVQYWEEGSDHRVNRTTIIAAVGFEEHKGHLRRPIYAFSPLDELGSNFYPEACILKLTKSRGD